MVLPSWQWTTRHVSSRDHTRDARGNIVPYELLEIRQDGVKPCRPPRITHDGIAPRRCPGSRETTSHHNPRNDSTWYKAKRDAPCLAERTSKLPERLLGPEEAANRKPKFAVWRLGKDILLNPDRR
ncbi:hypothetical protein BHE74_00055369 [Ensete ventricosum]|nr:hypothetical protein BHE74_00055369 [Ensete ventricosum]